MIIYLLYISINFTEILNILNNFMTFRFY